MSSVLQNGDIVLVKFHPGISSELKKYRPAVVVADLSDLDDRFVTVIPLTTQLKKLYPKVEVEIEHAKLKQKSLALCWYLVTLDRVRVQEKWGRLDKQALSKIKTAVVAGFQ